MRASLYLSCCSLAGQEADGLLWKHKFEMEVETQFRITAFEGIRNLGRRSHGIPRPKRREIRYDAITSLHLLISRLN